MLTSFQRIGMAATASSIRRQYLRQQTRFEVPTTLRGSLHDCYHLSCPRRLGEHHERGNDTGGPRPSPTQNVPVTVVSYP